ncbi:MAG: hypothetical protein O3B21_14575 [Proteobacteria bacterium]|nr:hypothetical protein [Pseudomonadota bacterium]
MAFYFTKAAVLFFAPFLRHLVKEGCVDPSIKFVHVHGVDPITQALVLRFQALDRFFVFAPFIRMAGVQGVPHPIQHLVVEVKEAQHIGELLFQDFLAHMLATA